MAAIALLNKPDIHQIPLPYDRTTYMEQKMTEIPFYLYNCNRNEILNPHNNEHLGQVVLQKKLYYSPMYVTEDFLLRSHN